MPYRSDTVRAERAAIRAEMAEIVALAGEGGQNIKDALNLAARRLGINFRRARAFRTQSADPWAHEADRLRALQRDMLRRQAENLRHKAAIIEARLNAHENRVRTNDMDHASTGAGDTVRGAG